MFKIREEFKKAHPDIAEKIMSDEYSFFKENEHLNDNVILLGLGGSYAYGLNKPDSDIDIRGVAINKKEELLGLSNFEQFENRDTDTVVYGVGKFFELLSACNPNIIEMVGLRDEDYIYISPIGQMILDNKELFLSKRAAHSFGGYANAQLRRIQTASARDRLPNALKQEFISQSMESAIGNLFTNHDLEKYGNLHAHVDSKSEKIVVDSNFKDLPLGEFTDMMNVCKQVNSEYEKSFGNRNNKKDDKHLNKHASHLFRLMNMGTEILKDHKVNTYRTEDRDFLKAVKDGSYMLEDGTFKKEMFDKITELKKEMDYWEKNTTLPSSPDYNKISDLLIKVNEEAINFENIKNKIEKLFPNKEDEEVKSNVAQEIIKVRNDQDSYLHSSLS